MQALLFELMRAVAPRILSIVKEQFLNTGTLPTVEELDAKLVEKADKIIAKGEDWLKNHPE